MQTPSYWPTVNDATATGPTPQDLLKQQADLLATQTGGVLYGDVIASARGEKITLDLFVVAPKLNDYSYRLFKVRYNPIEPFTKVEIVVPETPLLRINGEQEYQRVVADLLGSQTTASVISQLLGLSKQASVDGPR